MHRHADALAHAPDKKRVPAGQDNADAVSPAPGPRGLPLGRCFVTVFVDHFLYAFAHLGRNVRPSVDHAVNRAARHAALLCNPLCSYLHQPFPLRASPVGGQCIRYCHSNTQAGRIQAIRPIFPHTANRVHPPVLFHFTHNAHPFCTRICAFPPPFFTNPTFQNWAVRRNSRRTLEASE